MSRQEKIQEQIELAAQAIARHGYAVPASIKEVRLTPKAKKTYYGFDFSGLQVGYKGRCDDGSVFEIVAVVNP